MQSAIIKNGTVTAVLDGDSAGLGAMLPTVQIVSIPESMTVTIGQVYVDGTFVQPPPVTALSRRDFLARFTQAERIAIRTAMASDPIIEDANQLMTLADYISIDDTDAVQYVGYLAQQGLIDAARVAEILAPVVG